MTAEHQIGTPQRPLRVAIIGSGPAGFFAADALLKAPGLIAEVDVFDRLPTPYGLVRAGVAPDHQKIKRVVRRYDQTAEHERFRFIGNVRLGELLTVADLKTHYDQIVYAVGADSGRELNVPGRGAARFHPAAVFVGWYNSHPDYRRANYDCSVERVAIIGHGNVALDVSRILAKSDAELAQTDIASHAREALRTKRVTDIYVIGRGGPLDATFTPPELREYRELTEAVAVVDPADVAPTAAFEAQLATASKSARRNIEVLRGYAAQSPEAAQAAKIRVHFIFNSTTHEVLVDEQGGVAGVRLRRTGTEDTYDITVGMVIPAIGFTTTPIEGVEFDAERGRISNQDGRITVAKTGEVVPNQYVVGWARTGPQGVIGMHKGASREVVAHMLVDLKAGTVPQRDLPDPAELPIALEDRGAKLVSFDDWKALNALELVRGEMRGAPREKLTDVADMLHAVGKG